MEKVRMILNNRSVKSMLSKAEQAELESELQAAEKALEKQTAKKAYEEMQDGIQLAIRCPICDHAVSYKQKCCHWCGQKLDWSEQNENETL